MHDETPLIALIALGLVLSFICGYIAMRLKLSPVFGYLLAGIIMGPHTPGFSADTHIAGELAEIGVVLLMFGVGMHFSMQDILDMRTVAVPGAIIQILTATALSVGVGFLWGWPFGAGLIFGLALSVASTVVMLRALDSFGALNTPDGKITIGWTVVEDVVMVLVLVLLPAFFDTHAEEPDAPVLVALGMALGKVFVFIGLMLVFGTRVFPWLLQKVERIGSREMFTLAVVSMALGVAFGAAKLLGISFALGAFFAGVVIHRSDLHHRATATLEPLQDAFGTLFFVAIGMLFDPMILVQQPGRVLIVVAIIMLGKSIAAYVIVRLLRRPRSTALIVSVALAQIGEFSFILAGLGVALGLLSSEAQSLIIAGALLSIALNSLAFYVVSRLRLFKAAA